MKKALKLLTADRKGIRPVKQKNEASTIVVIVIVEYGSSFTMGLQSVAILQLRYHYACISKIVGI